LLEAQARRNFDAAHEHTTPVLDEIRSAFWDEFAQFAQGRA